jgi:uncharacterized membrane protein
MADYEIEKRESDLYDQRPGNRLPQQSTAYDGSRRSRWMSPSDGWSEKDNGVVEAQGLARALGWFSIGLGLTELAVPGTVARFAGLNGNRGLVRALGLREIAHGVGILSRRKPVGWLWSRVFGDVLDLAVLGKAAASPHADKLRVAAAAAAVTGITVLDFKASQQLSEVAYAIEEDDAIDVNKSILINRPVEEIYRYWRDFENLPRVMAHLESVQVIDEKRSRWTAKGPGGRRIEWEAEITADRPNELIAWRSLEGASVENSGSVRFDRAPGGRGTLLRVELSYRPPAGQLGAAIAKLLGEEPKLQVDEDLRRLKQVMEAGEIVTTEGQPAGRTHSTSWKYDRVGRRLAAGF